MTAESWRAEAEELRRRGPRHILFLCVANSARSQMAEGIARALAPAGPRILSAGSRPSAVHPLAVRAMAEIGLDISSHRSKPVSAVPLDEVDLVVTLCAEEVCPVLPRAVTRLHWGLPDPASGEDGEPGIERFRLVRDELRRRLEALLGAP